MASKSPFAGGFTSGGSTGGETTVNRSQPPPMQNAGGWSWLPGESGKNWMQDPFNVEAFLDYMKGGGAVGAAGRAGEELKGAIPEAAGAQAGAIEAAQAGFEPYAGAGEAAIQQQQALAGLLGPEAQQAAIAQLEASPQFQAMAAQGERAILQNAAATGGLRGGNVQAMLAQYRPQLLTSLIEQQYTRLGGLSAAGLSATGSQAALAPELGAIRAGGILGPAQFEYMQRGREAEAAGAVAKETLGAIPQLIGTAGKLFGAVL